MSSPQEAAQESTQESLQGNGNGAAIVVVNYGSHRLLEHNMAGRPWRQHGLSVVVVDNFSTAAERAAVSRLADRNGWTALLQDDNPGFGEAVNAGVEHALAAGADSVVLLNPDAVLAPAAAARLVDVVRHEPMMLVAPRIVRPSGRPYFTGAVIDRKTGRVRSTAGVVPADDTRIPWITGACMAYSRQLHQATGGFPSGYFLYWEDVDFSLRVAGASGELMITPDVEALHDEGGTQEQDDAPARKGHSPQYYYYNCRNRLLFAARNLPRRQAAGWLLCTPVESFAVLRRGGRRPLVTPVLVWATVRGTAAGSWQLLRALLSRPRTTGTPR